MFEHNTDWLGPGGDEIVEILKTGVIDEMDCASKCGNDLKCEYFVFAPKEKTCWLKKNFQKKAGNNDRIAGPRCFGAPGKCFFLFLKALVFHHSYLLLYIFNIAYPGAWVPRYLGTEVRGYCGTWVPRSLGAVFKTHRYIHAYMHIHIFKWVYC